MNKVAIFPGSFDPFTKGHEDLVVRGSKLFDQLIIAIGVNTNKKRFFPEEEMYAKIENHFKGYPNITVQIYSGLTSKFAKEVGANYILRGLRNTTDFEYENSLGQANKFLNKDLETIYLITDPSLAHISSTLVRDIHKYGADTSKFICFKL